MLTCGHWAHTVPLPRERISGQQLWTAALLTNNIHGINQGTMLTCGHWALTKVAAQVSGAPRVGAFDGGGVSHGVVAIGAQMVRAESLAAL